MATAGEMNELHANEPVLPVEFEQFCYSVLDILNTTKATIELCDKDIIKNCNTSMYNACKFIERRLLLLSLYVDSGNTLKADANTLILNIKEILLRVYREHFSRWFEYNVVKAEKENPDFYNDLYCIQKLEKEYPHYDDMLKAFVKCQELFTEFKGRLGLHVNPDKEE